MSRAGLGRALTAVLTSGPSDESDAARWGRGAGLITRAFGEGPGDRCGVVVHKHYLANARSKVGAATTAQLVWILAPRLPEPEGPALPDE